MTQKARTKAARRIREIAEDFEQSPLNTFSGFRFFYNDETYQPTFATIRNAMNLIACDFDKTGKVNGFDLPKVSYRDTKVMYLLFIADYIEMFDWI